MTHEIPSEQAIGPTLETWFGANQPKCPLPGLKWVPPAEEKRRRDAWVARNGGLTTEV